MACGHRYTRDPGGTCMAVVDDCEKCEQKELCPVYSGDHCLLVQEHEEELKAWKEEAL